MSAGYPVVRGLRCHRGGNTTTHDVTRGLAEHASRLRYGDLPEAVREKACQLVLDLLGIAVRAAADVESTPSIRDAVLAIAAPGEATAIGAGRTLGPAHAALLNGSLAHSLDFDDTHRDGSVHPGAAVIPLVLALAEQHGIGGQRVLAAIVAGYDVTCRVARALGPKGHYDRGFHPTGTAGVFGATAAGANLLGLSAGELGAAFGVNGSQAAASMQFLANGGWNKRIHPGLAAHDAVFALELAHRGFRGSAHAFEGPDGLLHGYSDDPHPDRLLAGLGTEFEIMQTAVKPYPACRYAHAPLDMLIELAEAHDLDPAAVESVTVGLSEAALKLVGLPIERKRDARSIVDGQFSMPFLAAVALQRRRMAWGDYELIGDEATDRLAAKVDVVSDAEADAVYPGRWLASVEVVTAGATLSDRRWTTRGEPESPLAWPELEQKFDGLVDGVLGGRDRDALVAAVRGLAALDDLSPLGAPLRAVRPAPAP